MRKCSGVRETFSVFIWLLVTQVYAKVKFFNVYTYDFCISLKQIILSKVLLAWKKGHFPQKGSEYLLIVAPYTSPPSLALSLPTLSRCLGGSEELGGFSPRRERVPDLISLLWMELYLCCLVKQHKCKRGVNCFHITFKEQMRREMHFTGTRTGGGCLAWCNGEHLFLFPQGCWIISEHGYCRGRKSRGWGHEYRRQVKHSALSCT